MNRQSARTQLVLFALLLVPVAVFTIGTALTPAATDFLCFWTGARFTLDGRDPYDAAAWAAATGGYHVDMFGGLRPTNCPGAYAYPLTTAVAMIPLGAFPIGVAAVIWQMAFVLGLGAGLVFLARAAGLGRSEGLMLAVIVGGSQPLGLPMGGAGFGGLLVLATGLLATQELVHAGPVLGTLLAALKPHAIPFAVLVRLREFRSVPTIVAALAPIYVLVLASLIVDPGWPAKWGGELLGHRLEMAAVGQSATLWMLGRVAGIPALAPFLIGIGISALAIALWRVRGHVDRLEAIALAIVAWQLVVPYALSGDQVPALAVIAVVVMRRAAAAPGLMIALLAIGLLLPWMLYAIRYDVLAYGGLEVTNALVPLALALLLAVAIGRRRPGNTVRS